MSLGDKYGPLRLERVSAMALSRTSSPSYSQLKSILEKDLDASAASETEPCDSNSRKDEGVKSSGRGHRRGADYFGG